MPLAVVVACLLSFPQAAFAYSGVFWDQGHGEGNLIGVHVNALETANPAVTFSTSSAWVMVNRVGGQTYAQDGYLKYSSWVSPQMFSEWHNQDTGQGSQQWWGVLGSGAQVKYQVALNAAGTRYLFQINGTTLSSVSTSDLGFTTAGQIQAGGETHDTRDQMPGRVGNKVLFDTVQYFRSDRTWRNTTLQSYISPDIQATAGNSIPSGGAYSFYIWDKRY
jgi:hypothetical protein